MSYNIEQPITGELASAKANKGGDDITNPATWRTNLDVPTVLDSRRRTLIAGQPGVVFDNAGTTRITSTLGASQAIGTSPFTLWFRFRVPLAANLAANGSGLFSIASGATSGGNAGDFEARFEGSSVLSVYFRAAGSASLVNATLHTIAMSSFAGQVVDLVLIRNGTSLTAFINGASVTVTPAVAGTDGFAHIGDAVNGQYFHVGLFSTAAALNDRMYRAVLFNRALSASDVTSLIITGVDDADRWGTQTTVYTSDFSAGVDGMSGLAGANSTLAGNIDAIAGQNDNLRVTTGTFSGTIAGIFRGGLVRGKRYRLNFSYYVPSSNVTARGVRAAFFNNGSAGEGAAQLVTNTWTAVSEISQPDVFASGSNVNFAIHVTNSAGSTNFNGTSGDVVYLRGITLVRVGALVDLNFQTGAGATAYDNSSNLLHGAIVGGVSWVVPATPQTVAPAGTAAAPGITTAGDTDTGVSFPAANTMALNTGGVERARVKAGGQVRFIPLATAPASPEIGDVYYDSTTNRLTVYTNAGWASITHTVI